MPRKNLALFVCIVILIALAAGRAFSEDKYLKQMQTFAKILTVVRENYVTPVESDQLFEGAYRGMLATLDPYTQYFTKPENESFSQETEGEFGGLGIEIAIREGVLMVISPIRGTPAYEGGILAGDMILKVDGKSTERITTDEAIKLLRGKVGTKVTLTIRHYGAAADKEITLTRAIIMPSAVEYDMVDEKNSIALLRITSFTAKVMDDMEKAVKELQKRGMKSLVLDLRGDPGGYLDQAVAMADLFLTEGPIVSVRGRRPEMEKIYNAKPGGSLEKTPLVVIVDEGSASASEIVAGALHDTKRGLLVGTRTYGKGSVQNVIPLGDGEALKITTARYYTPSGKPIEDRKGIAPDIFVPMTREQIVALRDQEREDKLRNHFRLGDVIEETLVEAAGGAEKAPEPSANDPRAKEGPVEKPNPKIPPDLLNRRPPPERRSRVIDYQLQAAVNLLRWDALGSARVSAAESK